MFMFDIDHFKDINDRYGHLFGNAILSMVAKELKQAISGQGVAARWGGDEFIGVLAVEPDKAVQIITQFMNALKESETDSRCPVTISVGIAEISNRHDADAMITTVDKALYHSKETGRNRITVSVV